MFYFAFFTLYAIILTNKKEGDGLVATRLQELKWNLHCFKDTKLLIWGLKNGLIFPYSDKLIEKLRNVYYGGIPASIILLCDALTNGHCYDRALLLAKAFINDEDDIKLIYASINSIKLNPMYIDENSEDPLYADHCFLERITKDGRHLIYDTTTGFVYDKSIYWKIENPKVRHINDKESIKRFIEEDKEQTSEDLNRDKYAAPLIISNIERTYGRLTEKYSAEGIELLQREVEHYKDLIKYDELVKEIEEDMKRLCLANYK